MTITEILPGRATPAPVEGTEMTTGIGPTQRVILDLLAAHGPLGTSDIAYALDRTSAQITVAVNALERRGLVTLSIGTVRRNARTGHEVQGRLIALADRVREAQTVGVTP